MPLCPRPANVSGLGMPGGQIRAGHTRRLFAPGDVSDHRDSPDPRADFTDLLDEFPYLSAPHAIRV